jgi:hypothetical protein
MRDSRSGSQWNSRRKQEKGFVCQDGVQIFSRFEFRAARTRNASRGREAPEEWASPLLFFFGEP